MARHIIDKMRAPSPPEGTLCKNFIRLERELSETPHLTSRTVFRQQRAHHQGSNRLTAFLKLERAK